MSDFAICVTVLAVGWPTAIALLCVSVRAAAQENSHAYTQRGAK